MNRNKLDTLLLLGVALALVCASATAAVAQDVPFHAGFSGIVQFTSESTAVLDGVGKATHMGRITMHGDLSVVGPASCEGGSRWRTW